MALDPMTMAMIAQAGYGLYRGIKAQQGLNELQKQKMPSRMEAIEPMRENYNLYRQQYRTGMGPGSLNLARQQFGVQQAGLLQTPASGQLRDVMGRVAAANTGQFALNLAAQNEQIRRAGLAGMASTNIGISGLQERDAIDRLQNRLRQEQAYGQAAQQGFQDVLGAFGGYAMGKANAASAAEDRALVAQIYGLNKQTPVANSSDYTSLQASSPAAYNNIMGTGNPTQSYSMTEYGVDLGLPTLGTKYSTPKTRFR